MLYHAYDAHRDILAPFRLFAETAHNRARSALARRLGVFARRRRGARYVLEWRRPARAARFRHRPGDGRRGRDGSHRGSRRDRSVLPARAFPQGGRARTAEAAGCRAAVRAFRDAAARHRRHGFGRPRRLRDRLGQRAQRAGAIWPLRPRRRDRAADQIHPAARAGLSCAGGVSALGPGSGGGVADGGCGRSVPAGLDGADGRADRPGRQPDRGQPLRAVALAVVVRAHGRHDRADALSRRLPPRLSRVSAARRVSQHEFRPPCRGALADVPAPCRG